jgi:hypothetical protein
MDALMIHVADVSCEQSDRAAKLPVSDGNDVFRTRHGVALDEDFFVLQIFHLRRENANGELRQQGGEGLGHRVLQNRGAAFGEVIGCFNFRETHKTPDPLSLRKATRHIKNRGSPVFIFIF